MSEAQLIEITPNDWPKLRDLWAVKPTDTPGYQCLSNFIHWQKKESDLEIKLLSLNGNWQTDGTFLICWKLNDQIQHLYFNSLNDNLESLRKALEILPATADQYLVSGFSSRLLPAATGFSKRFPEQKFQVNETIWYHASKELVSSFAIELPPGITLRRLDIKDAETINEIWPHRQAGSIDFVNRMIKYNVNVGACDETGKLVAWCLRLSIGALGLVQVMESHKRLGLGNLLVRYLSKKISELGNEVLAPVMTANTPSRKMFEKLGFQPIDRVHWMFSIK